MNYNTHSDEKVSSLSVIVPAYEEEILLEDTIKQLVNTITKFIEDPEIIIINDGSTDLTGQIAEELSKSHKFIFSYHQEQNQGFGEAIRLGFAKASKEYVTFIPADHLFSAEELDIYLTIIKYADIVIGYRRGRREDLGLYPWLISVVYHNIVNWLFGIDYYDVNWIHLYKRDQLEQFLGRSDGVFLLAENLIRCRELKLKVVGVDVDFIERSAGVATGRKVSTILKTLSELLKFWYTNRLNISKKWST